MIWRSPELEALLGAPLEAGALSESTLERLVRDRAQESDVIDFKVDSWPASRGPRSGWTSEQEFAKDVAAFANHRCGAIFVGVEEVSSVATGLAPLPASLDTEQEERRLRQALLNYQAPLATCEFLWVTASAGGWYCIILVQPSPRSPHAVLGPRSDSRTPLRYPQRHGTETVWLSEPEVAERYRRRLTAQADEASRLSRIVSHGTAALVSATGVWLYAALIPELPMYGRLDARTVEDLDAWHRESSQQSPLGRTIPAHGRGIPGPGKVTFTGSPLTSGADETEIRDAYVELHVDGSAFAAVPITQRTSDEAETSRAIGETTLVDDTILLVDLLTRWTAERSGAWGTGPLTIGLTDAGFDATLRSPIEYTNAEAGELRRMQRTRRLAGEVFATVSVDLAAVDTLQQRLAVAHHALAGLLQLFGIAEPPQLLSSSASVSSSAAKPAAPR